MSQHMKDYSETRDDANDYKAMRWVVRAFCVVILMCALTPVLIGLL